MTGEYVNITPEGRRLVVAEPEWFPRPDGLERAVVFGPGYNSAQTGNPHADFGVHGMEIIWYLRGPLGVAQFMLYTDWIPGTLRPGHGLPPAGMSFPRIDYPMGADLGYHAPVPQWEGQEEYRRDDCRLLPGGTCYYDGSGMAAERVAKEFVLAGEPAVWAALEDRYADLAGAEGS